MKKIDKGTIYVIIGVLVICMTIITITRKRNSQLNNDFSLGVAKITEVVLNAPKGTTQTENIAKYYYIFNGKKYNKVVGIYKKRIKKGECYEIKIANKNPYNSKINLKKKINCNVE